MSEEIRKGRTVEAATAFFAEGFTGLLSRIDRERDKQLVSPEEYRVFLKAYDAAYPKLYSAIAKSYSTLRDTYHPLELIRVARDVRQEAEKQALVIVGTRILEQTKDANKASTIIRDLAFQNEINLTYTALDHIHAMQGFLNRL